MCLQGLTSCFPKSLTLSFVARGKPKVIVQVYSSDTENALTVVVHGDPQQAWLLESDAVLLYQIQASTWIDAMKEHHRKQGWEPYKPMED